MYSSTSGCIGLRNSSVVIGKPSSRSVDQSHEGAWAVIHSRSEQARGSAIPPFVSGVSLSYATSMFARHLFMASIESATSSALVSQPRSGPQGVPTERSGYFPGV